MSIVVVELAPRAGNGLHKRAAVRDWDEVISDTVPHLDGDRNRSRIEAPWRVKRDEVGAPAGGAGRHPGLHDSMQPAPELAVEHHGEQNNAM